MEPTNYLTVSEFLNKGTYKHVFTTKHVEKHDGKFVEPYVFKSTEHPDNLVIVIIPLENLNLKFIYKEIELHYKFARNKLAPTIYSVALVHELIQPLTIRFTTEYLLEAGSFDNAVGQYLNKNPSYENAINDVYAVALLEERCSSFKWKQFYPLETIPNIVFAITELFDATVESGFIMLDMKIGNLCPKIENGELKKMKAIDFDVVFTMPFELFFGVDGHKYAFMFMAIMIYTDMLRYMHRDMHYAIKETWKAVFYAKDIKQTDIRNMANECYEYACESVILEEQLEYNPLNMIYFYKMDTRPNDEKYSKTCEEIYHLKEEIINYLLQITQPLFAQSASL